VAQAVSRRPLTVESRVPALVNPCGICGGQSSTGQVFLKVLRVSPVNIIPPSFSILIYIIRGTAAGQRRRLIPSKSTYALLVRRSGFCDGVFGNKV
jgi:hypothetical protein